MRRPALILLLIFVSPAAVAEIYAFVDADGVTHFSNVPADSRYEVVLGGGEDGTADPPIHPTVLALSVRYDAIIHEAAAGSELDPDLLRAVIVVESGFDPDATSSAGARGLMQLMPETARSYGVSDVFDPRQNVLAGAAHLRYLIDRYGDDYELALAAYNAGEHAVEKYGGRIPPYSETRAYVPKVLGLFDRLQKLGNRG